MKITEKVVGEIIYHEGFVREAYKDSVGVWTWGFGLTNATGHNIERYIDNPQSSEKCITIFKWALEKYADDVRTVFDGYDLTEEQFAAALSFHWNTGSIKRASWVKAFKSGNLVDAERRFMQWKKPPEILKRREAEAILLFRGVWSGDGTCTEYTRLTSKHTPVWRSAKRVDLSRDLHNIFNKSIVTSKPPTMKAKTKDASVFTVLWSIFANIIKGSKDD